MSSLLQESTDKSHSVEEQSSLKFPLLITNNSDSEDNDSVSTNEIIPMLMPRPSVSFLGKLTNKYCHLTLAFWLLVIPPIGLYSLPHMLKGADSTFRPVAGTSAANAEIAYREAYHNPPGGQMPIIAILEMEDDHSATKKGTLTDGKSEIFNSTRAFVHDYIVHLQQQYEGVSIESFYNVYAEYPILAEHVLASADGRTTLLKIIPPITLVSKLGLLSFAEKVTSYADSTKPPEGVRISYTGLILFQRDMTASSKRDLARLDTIALPLSLLILGYALGCALPLLLVPILTIFSTICLWSGVMYFLMCYTRTPVVQTTPSVMMSLTIAMSVDYSLFYLSRTLEEIRRIISTQNSNSDDTSTSTTASSKDEQKLWLQQANQTAMTTSGHSILVSGCTLSVCLVGLVILPLGMMVSLGIGCCVAVLSCIVVSLTMIPSMLNSRVGTWMIFHQGWIPTEKIMNWCKSLSSLKMNRNAEECGVDSAPLLDHDVIEYEQVAESKQHSYLQGKETKQSFLDQKYDVDYEHVTESDQHNSLQGNEAKSSFMDQLPTKKMSTDEGETLWMRMGKYMILDHTRAKIVLCLSIVFLFVPVSSFLFKLKSSISVELMLPYSSPALASFETLGKVFGKGALSPYKIVFSGVKGGTRIDSKQGFNFMHTVLSNLTLDEKVRNNLGISLTQYEHSFSYDEKRSILATFCDLEQSGAMNETSKTTLAKPSYQLLQSEYRYNKSLRTEYGVHDMWNSLVHQGENNTHIVNSFIHGVKNYAEEKPIELEALREYFENMMLQVLDDIENHTLMNLRTSNNEEEGFDQDKSRQIARDKVSKYDYQVLRQTLTRRYEDKSLIPKPPVDFDNVDFKIMDSDISTKTKPIIQRSDHLDHSGSSALSSFSGISVLSGIMIPYSVYETSMLCEYITQAIFSTQCPVQAMRTLSFLSNQTCSKSHEATYVIAALKVDPFSSEGIEWLNSARSVINTLVSLHNHTFDVYILGGAAIEYDAVTAVYASFPNMVCLTMLVVFIFMGVSFLSVGSPVRSVFSIGVTLAFVYGFAVLVYQYGILNWMNIRGLSYVGEISFLPPLVAFTICVGLGLDYDVFLTTRIVEYRMAGHTHTASILLGLEKTGRIITFAGVIMCVAFGGMLFSESITLNQFSFFLVSAVLLDTFVVRTILVPIMLELSGDKWSWWPRKLPNGVNSEVVPDS